MQNLIVGLIVGAALWFVARRYLPVAVRRAALRALSWLTVQARWTPVSDYLSVALTRSAAPVAACAGGCSGCPSSANAAAVATGGTERSCGTPAAATIPIRLLKAGEQH